MFPNLRLLFLRFFIVVQEIIYPSCFIVYYEIKQIKKRRISLFRRSHEWDWMQPRSQGLLGIQNGGRPAILTAEKTLGTRLGLDGIWILSQITQNPLRLARITHIVLRTTQSRLWLAIQAANYRGNYWQSYVKGSLSLEVPSFVLFEHQVNDELTLIGTEEDMVRGDPVCRKEDCSQYDIGLVFKEISSYSDQDKHVETRWAIWLPSFCGMFEF